MEQGTWNGPPPIYVFVTVQPTAKNGIEKPFTSRVGTCREEKDIAKVVAEDLTAMGNTFGGLIDPTDTSGRTYRAFRAVWTELDMATMLKKSAEPAEPARPLRWESVPYGRGSVEAFVDVPGIGRYLVWRSDKGSREFRVSLNGQPTKYRGTSDECKQAVERIVAHHRLTER